MTAKQRATRAGFTLVEILMVIAIIAILAALLTTGISRVRGTAKKVQAANDITQLETVATKFKQDFGFYPPSHVTVTPDPNNPNVTVVMRFMVPNKPSGAGTAQNEASLRILQRMFPRWQPTVGPSGNLGIALAGSMLDPNQALVYFLGGPGTLAGGEPGFDASGPGIPTGTTKKGPYFDFPASRLAIPDRSVTGYDSGNDISNFLDPWGVPYAYFTASGDSYDGRFAFPFGPIPTAPSRADPGFASTTYTVTATNPGMRPFRAGNKWVNAGKMQIVSAGPNRLFGPGSAALGQTSTTPPQPIYFIQGPPQQTSDWQAGKSTGYTELDPGEDDLANFNEGTALGTSSAP